MNTEKKSLTVKFVQAVNSECQRSFEGLKARSRYLLSNNQNTVGNWIDDAQAILAILRLIRYGDVLECFNLLPVEYQVDRSLLGNYGDVSSLCAKRGKVHGNELFCTLSSYQLELWQKMVTRKRKGSKSGEEGEAALSLQISNASSEIDATLVEFNNYFKRLKVKNDNSIFQFCSMDCPNLFLPGARLHFSISSNGLSRKLSPSNKYKQSKVFGAFTTCFKSILSLSKAKKNKSIVESPTSASTSDKENMPVNAKCSSDMVTPIKPMKKLASLELCNNPEATNLGDQASAISSAHEIPLELKGSNADALGSNAVIESATTDQALAFEEADLFCLLEEEEIGMLPSNPVQDINVGSQKEDADDENTQRNVSQEGSAAPAFSIQEEEELAVRALQDIGHQNISLTPMEDSLQTSRSNDSQASISSQNCYLLNEYDEGGNLIDRRPITVHQAADVAQKYHSTHLSIDDVHNLSYNEIMRRSEAMMEYSSKMNEIGNQIMEHTTVDLENAYIWYVFASLKSRLEGKNRVGYNELISIFIEIDNNVAAKITKHRGYTFFNKEKAKISRKLRAAYFTLFLGFEGVTKAVVSYCNSSSTKGLFNVDTSRSNSGETMMKAFKELGKSHISFNSEEEKKEFNEDFIRRKSSNYGFAPTTSFRNPNSKPRGRKPGLSIPSSSLHEKRAHKRTLDDLSKMVAPEKRTKRHQRKEESKEETVLKGTKGQESEKNDASSSESDIEIPVQGASKEAGLAENDKRFHVRCSLSGLEELCSAMALKRDYFSNAFATKTGKNLKKFLVSGMNAVLESVCDEESEYPFQSIGGSCCKCSISSSNCRIILKCNRESCSNLKFCENHIRHSSLNGHRVETFVDERSSEHDVFIYGNHTFLVSNEAYEGVYARKKIPSGQLFGRLFYVSISREFFEEGRSHNSLKSMFSKLDNRYLLVPRKRIAFRYHTANFVRNKGSKSANCRLVWGSEEDFESCVFLSCTADIGESEEIILEAGGIDDEDFPILEKMFPKNGQKMLDLTSSDGEDNREEDEVKEFYSFSLFKQWEDRPRVYFELLEQGENNVQLFKDLIRGSPRPSLEEIKARLREEADLKIFISYNAQSSYDRTAGNGLCYFNSLYQTIVRNKEPDKYFTVPRFPRDAEYIDLFARTKKIQDMMDVGDQNALETVFRSIDATFKDLCQNSKTSYPYGEFGPFAYMLSVFPKYREPHLTFMAFESLVEKPDMTTQLYCLINSPFIASSFTGVQGLRYNQAEVLFNNIRNYVFYARAHFWVLNGDIKEDFLFSLSEALDELALKISYAYEG